MIDRDHKQWDTNWGGTEHDHLDREMNAALAKYAAVEPRTGLEERVLANLRTAPAQGSDWAWWRWSVAAALAAMLVVAVTLAWRSDKPSHPVAATQPSTTTQDSRQPGTQAESNREGNSVRPQAPSRPTMQRHRPPPVMASTAPKLDQFPSPQALSEQEKLLQKYVAEDPERAVLVARVISEGLRQDHLEETKALPSGDQGMDSE